MDVSAKLDELSELIESARAMPMSASCIVNRDELLAVVAELRELLPQELHQARGVLDDRSKVLEGGRAEAATIVEDAEAERGRMLARTEVARKAAAEADRILEAAQADADRMRTEVDEYIDARLANFEIVLQKTLTAVARGRAKIGGRLDLDALAPPIAETLTSGG